MAKPDPGYRSVFLLLGVIFLAWLWVNNPVLAQYLTPATAGLVLGYFTVRLLVFHQSNPLVANLVLDTAFLTPISLLLIAATGGLNSPFFFLVYLLLFALALVFETLTALILTLALILFYINDMNTVQAAIQVASLLVIAPIAVFFSRQYADLIRVREQVKQLAQEGQQLNQAVQQEETAVLFWLALNFKHSLLKITHLSSELLSDIGRLNLIQKEKLQSLHQTAKEILKSGEKLEKQIDRVTDAKH